MQTYIAILRGINVSGQKRMLMADLKALFEALKFTGVQTYIQSGNVIFKTKEEDDTLLAAKIEKAIAKKYGFEVPVIIRTTAELASVISRNPLLKNKKVNMERVYVTFLAGVPEKAKAAEIEKLSFAPDEFIIDGKEVFLHIPVAYGETKLSNNFFEKKLKVTATTRNWATVNKLYELASA
jgi:uncharacterized protein (DUF1697 family)